jgi:hypothetical protein
MTSSRAAAELTRLGEELGPDVPADEVVALCKEARRELAAENAERHAIARRRPPHWAGED